MRKGKREGNRSRGGERWYLLRADEKRISAKRRCQRLNRLLNQDIANSIIPVRFPPD